MFRNFDLKRLCNCKCPFTCTNMRKVCKRTQKQICEVDLFLDYYCKTIESGGDYIGTIARTVSGRTCQRWEVQFPHKHEFGEELPGSAAAHRNYCRNPGNKMAGGPWCFTTDPSMEWEYCEIPMCRKY